MMKQEVKVGTQVLQGTLSLGEHYFSGLNVPKGEESDIMKLLDPEVLLELGIIAQQVSRDLELSVEVGKPAEGSYFSFEPPKIALDPLDIIEDSKAAKFVAGHEGAHRRWSPNPKEVLSSAEVSEYFGQLGFHSTMNVIEDCAINDAMSRELVGMGHHTTHSYAQADQHGFMIATPEVKSITQALGREPKFAKVLIEIVRDWHRWRKEFGYEQPLDTVATTGRYLDSTEASLLKVLRKTRAATRAAISHIPVVGEKNPALIAGFGRRRLEITAREIFPSLKSLIDQDLQEEAQRQALNDKNQSQGGTQDHQHGALEDALSPHTKKELARAIHEFFKNEAGKEIEERTKIEEAIAEEQAAQAALAEDATQEARKTLSGSSDRGQEIERKRAESRLREELLKKKLNAQFGDLQEIESGSPQMTQEELIEKRAQCMKKVSEESGQSPLPLEQLSPRAQKELSQAFETLSKQEQERYEKLAEEQLQKLEHEIVKALRPKLDADPIETEIERREKQLEYAEQADHNVQQERRLAEIRQEMEHARKKSLGAFDRVFEEITAEVNAATHRLQRILIPQSFFQWRKDRQTGSRLNLSRALQSEADPRYLGKLFEQRLNPTKRTHALEILVDTSWSMDGSKMKHTFQGTVFLSALCESLGIPFEIIEFNDSTTLIKRWKDSIKDDSIRNFIGTLECAKNAGTKDAPALLLANKRIDTRDTAYKFIVVLTDAGSEVSSDLQRALREIERNFDKTVIHFGIGAGTRDEQGYYKHSYSELSPELFFSKFCEVIEEIILSPDKFYGEDAHA